MFYSARQVLQANDSFGRYQIEAQLGSGGMGAVYRARDTVLDRRVALKVISPAALERPDATPRLMREARAAAAFEHAHVVTIFDVGEHGGVPFIAMELVGGRTLRAVIDERNTSVPTRLGYLLAIADALRAAHQRGLVHRDIKPENVIVRDDGLVKVLDFGIARLADQSGSIDPSADTRLPDSSIPSLTAEGVPIGTPLYMAPEQIQCEPIDGRTDQFAWGVVAFESLTGQLPWQANTLLESLAAMLTTAPDRGALAKAGASESLQRVILKALAIGRDDRFDSMASIVDALASDGVPAAADTVAKSHSSDESREPVSSSATDALPKTSPATFALPVNARRPLDQTLESRPVPAHALSLSENTPAGLARADDSIARVSDAEHGELAAVRQRWVRGRQRTFYRHAALFVVVTGLLQFFGFAFQIVVWTLIPAVVWGMGLGAHGVMALSTTEEDWRPPRQLAARRESRKRRRQKRVERRTE